MNNEKHKSQTFLISNEDEMVAFGEHLAKVCQKLKPKGCVLFLKGELGAGKTTLVRGFMRAFGQIHAVKSPTYTLVEPYEFGDISVYHFDFYRLEDPQDCEDMGIRDYLSHGFSLIEWPEKAKGHLPKPYSTLTISSVSDTQRTILVEGTSDNLLIDGLNELI